MKLMLSLVCVLCALNAVNGAKIDHFVVLMMENRAFDHMLGWNTLKGLNGLDGSMSNCVPVSNADHARAGKCYGVTRDAKDRSAYDPYHIFEAQLQQIFGYEKPVGSKAPPKMNGFAADADVLGTGRDPQVVMDMFDVESAPIINSLCEQFACFDNWFSAIPGPTDPNRAMAMSGTARGSLHNYNGTKWKQRSYMDLLTSHDISWRAYYDEDVWALGYFEDLVRLPNSLRVGDIEEFFELDRMVANFTWLQPSMHAHSKPPNWQHPDALVSEGERLIKRVYEKLRAMDTWNSTALLITYDEHGGFFDHVAPPQSGVPSPDNFRAPNGFNYDRLGVRLPTVVVSPLVDAGRLVTHPQGPDATSQFDGVSPIATANVLFGIQEYLTARHKWSATFEWIFNEEPRSDCPKKLTDIPMWTSSDLEKQRALPLNEHMEVQLQFYCDELHISPCPVASTQGEISDFIVPLVKQFVTKTRR